MNTSNLLSSLSQEQRGSIASSFKSVSGGAELTLHADLGGVGGAPAPHPCLTGNNSINVDTEEDKYLTELRKKDLQHYKEKVLPILSGYHKKKTYALQKTIEQACLEWGGEVHWCLASYLRGQCRSLRGREENEQSAD